MFIREMVLSDVPAIAELEKLCFSDPWSENSIASELGNRLSYWLVAEVNGGVVGYIGSQSVLDSADVMNIAVAPQCRRCGIGKMLIHELMTCLCARGIRFLILEVRVSNEPAIALYNQLGFCEIGRRPKYYRHPTEDALILRKELNE